MTVKMKVKKGDRVVVITGRDKGKVGTVLRAIPTESRVVVEGVNMVKRHTRQTARDQGGIVEKEGTIHVSNVAHVDPKSNKATRVGFKNLEDGRKVRVAKGSGEVIDV
ncbi:50S ribosomal protein L24 [Stella sp.]|uniref:50S ribosomal protein L24 n=1 Tax=Stella sp. TaxID=2912054 RepID=UPI0035B4D7E9